MHVSSKRRPKHLCFPKGAVAGVQLSGSRAFDWVPSTKTAEQRRPSIVIPSHSPFED